jgi:hypothetical protein
VRLAAAGANIELFVGMGVDHPSLLATQLAGRLTTPFSDPIQQFGCQRPAREFPRSEWFAVKDYRQKSRFLCAVSNKPLE